MFTITIDGKPETKSNALGFNFATKRAFINNAKSKYQKKVCRIAKNEMLSLGYSKPLEGYFNVNLIAYMPNMGVRDLSNLFKSAMDALNDVVYEDDAKIIKISNSYKRQSKHDPRLIINVEMASIEDASLWENSEPDLSLDDFEYTINLTNKIYTLEWKTKRMRKWRKWVSSYDKTTIEKYYNELVSRYEEKKNRDTLSDI